MFGEGALSNQRGYNTVLTVQERLSSFVKLYPLKTKKWSEISKVLTDKWMAIFRRPQEIMADNAFASEECTIWSQKHQVKLTIVLILTKLAA